MMISNEKKNNNHIAVGTDETIAYMKYGVKQGERKKTHS